MKRILLAGMALLAVPSAQAMGLAKNSLKYATVGVGGYTILNTIQNSTFGTMLLHMMGLQPTGAAQQAQALTELTAGIAKQAQEIDVLKNQFSAMKHEIGTRVVEEAKKHSSMLIRLMKDNQGIMAGLATVGAAVAWQNRLAIANLCVSTYNAVVSTYTAIKVHGIYKVATGTHKIVGELKQDVGEVKQDVNVLKEDTSVIKQGLVDVGDKAVQIEKQIDQLDKELKQAITNGNEDLAKKIMTQIDELKDELKRDLTSMKQQLAEIHAVVTKK